jgi:tetratricopeptide (TPR) repeat protein
LGSYVDIVYSGDIRRRKEIGLLASAPEIHGHALRVVQAYERWFQDQPELDVLRLLSVFDRPATAADLDVFRGGPPIPRLTEKLNSLSDQKWRIALRNVRKARLVDPVDANAPDDLDCHPLIRAFFAEEMRQSLPETWRLAHRRLYEHYKATTKELPTTIPEITRLYSAVAHGCEGSLFESAFNDVYWPRIQQGTDFASSRRLGAVGADLEALGHFFSHRWTQTVPNLAPVTRARIMTQAGFDLRGCGRLEEAEPALCEALRAHEELHDLPSAASVASNLSVLYLHLGKLAEAVRMAQTGVSYADRSGEPHRRAWERTSLADALHQCGKLAEARRLFEEVEEIEDLAALRIDTGVQNKDGFGVGADAIINRHHGFRHCDLLLSLGMIDRVLQKGTAQIEEGKASGLLLLQGLGHLSVGKARLAQSRLDSETAMHLNEAVTIVRKASQQHHIPRALIARSEFFRRLRDFSRSERDLDEAVFLAKRSGMVLHECDCQLLGARLSCDSGRQPLAREHYEAARRMVLAMGYHRRDQELTEIALEIERTSTN